MSILQIADFAVPVTTLGPGRRFVLWVQGCCFRCAGCTSPDWIPMAGGRERAVEELATSILDHAEAGIDGLTISGGEPLLQAAPLVELWQILRQAQPGLTLVLFTGFTQEEIAQSDDPSRRELAALADLLITGRYDRSLDDGLGLRGSTNQIVSIARPEWEPLRQRLEGDHRRLQLFARPDSVLFAGVPPTDFRRALVRADRTRSGATS